MYAQVVKSNTSPENIMIHVYLSPNSTAFYTIKGNLVKTSSQNKRYYSKIGFCDQVCVCIYVFYAFRFHLFISCAAGGGIEPWRNLVGKCKGSAKSAASL